MKTTFNEFLSDLRCAIKECCDALVFRLYKRTNHYTQGLMHDVLMHDLLDKMGAPHHPDNDPKRPRYGVYGRLNAWCRSTNPWTDAEIDNFIKELNEGKHSLSAEDEAALEKSKARLFEKVKGILHEH